VKAKIGKKSAGANQGRLSPFEDYLDLATMLKIRLRGREVGAYLLTKGKGNYRFVFGFDCQGIHTTLRDGQIDTIFDNLEGGLKDLPPGERITLHLGSFSSDAKRQEELSKLVQQAPSDDLKFLLMGEKARIQELTRLGVRKPKFLRIYVTYTVESAQQGAGDWIEKALAQGETLWNSFKDDGEEIERQRIDSLMVRAFTDGFQLWEQIVANKMGLDVRPMNEEDLWESLWSRFNGNDAPPIPQTLTLDQQGLSESLNSDVHATTRLLESVPVADRQWIKVRNQYAAPLTFLEKPGGWASKASQMRYLWNLIARDTITDTEIFCQLTRANETLVKTAVQRVLKQSNTSAQMAEDKRSIDVAAQLKTRKSVKAQEELYEGAIPIYTGVAIVVYRDNLERLDEACRYISSCFQRPAWVARETEYAWRVWLQTLPVVWEALMATPFNRRQLYLTGEVPGLMPLVCTRAGDKTGFELITEEGGTPVHLDLYSQHKNLALFATTRAGKSVLVSGILTHALAHGMPVVALDYPKPDGTSTFTDYTYFMGERGAYFDISKEFNNLFEIPDLRKLPEDQQRERFQDYQSFLESALMTMIIGSNSDELLTQSIRSVLALALTAFFKDPEIDARYQAAIEGGFGSPAWAETPTLEDFLPFCTQDRLQFEKLQNNLENAFQTIELQIRFWLNSRVGQSVSRPSSFRADAQLLVFALRNLSNDKDAAVLALSAYAAALRRALAFPSSIFFIDEAPILFEFDEISSLVGRLCANGAKAGVRVILSGQDPDTVAKSPAASKIFQNLSTRLIGRIQPTAVDSFDKFLKYPREIIGRNATDSFFPRKESIYSQWLLDDNGIYTFCRYYPAYVQLAAVANNPDEQSARTETMQQYPNKFEGLATFSRQLVASIRGGK
jgi:hypothetical protein